MATSTTVLPTSDELWAEFDRTEPAAPEAVGKSNCDSCGHGRRLHPGSGGCLHVDKAGDPYCGCPVRYMDL